MDCGTCSGKGEVSQPRQVWGGWRLIAITCPACKGTGKA